MGSGLSKKKIEFDKKIKKHKEGINCMTISRDKSLLATGSDDNNAITWNTINLIEYISIFK